MKNCNNAILGAFCVFFLLSAVILIGCRKNNSGEIPDQTDRVQLLSKLIHYNDQIDLKASDVISTPSFVQRKVELILRNTNTVYKTFFIEVLSATGKDIKQSIQDNSFSGSLVIKDENSILERWSTVLSPAVQSNSVQTNVAAELPMGCNVTNIHNCVARKIDDMNWVSYSFCLASAPACYAELWASCTWDACHVQN